MICDRITLKNIVDAALVEDIGTGDITTNLTIPENSRAEAVLTAKENGVICGMDVMVQAFSSISDDIVCKSSVCDGTEVNPGDTIAVYEGNTRAILTAERVGLNFLQHLSGVATATAKYVKLVDNPNVRIVDTRKTIPGLRVMEKYAVRIGGGYNHRFGLSDGILIKDNHIEGSGSITNAVEASIANAPHTLKIEVEVTDLDELKEAMAAGADAVLLDNMSLDMLREAVKINNGKVILEASGGINENTVAAVAETGVDLISSGALTHSVKALDISLNIKAVR